MKYAIRLIVFLAVAAAATQSSESYVQTPAGTTTRTPIAWNLSNPDTPIVSNGRVVYSLNSAGSDDLPFSQVEQEIATSFAMWENIPTSTIAFTRGPNTTSTTTTSDNLLQIFWLENSTTTGDGLNLAGALAVTRLTTYASGPRTGEIIDASLVFNGNQFRWATDGRAGSADVREVATHEIGHVIGLNHSPIGPSTMFPRSGPGRILSRSLEIDDQIAASATYPAAGFASSTGTIQGRVRDGSGNNIFGAHIAAVNGNGVVMSGALSLPDGTYTIQGLPPGNYTLYAEPLDPSDSTYFSRFDLPSSFSNINTDFLTTGDFAASVAAGATATRDFTVTRGTPALDAYFVSDSTGTSFRNVPNNLSQGQNNVSVGVIGPGLPSSGAPLSISGPGITILRTYFGTSDSGPAVVVDINVSATAPPGARNIIINNGSQRTIVTGGLEIIGNASAITTVSSANFFTLVAAESIVSGFGSNLATTTQSATTSPLPTTLGGTTVRLQDSAGNVRSAPLFFISPTQVNYQIAPGILTGPTTVTITSGNNTVSSGTILVDPVAPGLFSADASGKGLAAAVAFRVKANGAQSFESIISYDTAQNRFVSIPIDLGPATDQVFLILYGTGIRFRSTTPSVTIGGLGMQVTFSGPQGQFVGLDQVNVRLDRALIGRGLLNVAMIVDGRNANQVGIAVK